jgi:hypothetical protein
MKLASDILSPLNWGSGMSFTNEIELLGCSIVILGFETRILDWIDWATLAKLLLPVFLRPSLEWL